MCAEPAPLPHHESSIPSHTSARPPPVLTVVVPAHDSAATIHRCVASARTSRAVRHVIVVDRESSDRTRQVAAEAGAEVIVAGTGRSSQRNRGLDRVTTPGVVFLDSDMYASAGVLDEAWRLLESGFDAAILTEESVGVGYWARVRRLERECYVGDDLIEACRAFRTTFVRELGGFDEELNAFEDWDLTARARAAGAHVARTSRRVLHDEGMLTLRRALAKKGRKAAHDARYRSKHPELARRQTSAIARLRPFVRHAGDLVRRPTLALGVLVLKGLEFVAAQPRRPRTVD